MLHPWVPMIADTFPGKSNRLVFFIEPIFIIVMNHLTADWA